MAYTYEYPRPLVTVDIFLLRYRAGRLEILLIQRAHEPFSGKWALPGGFVDENEPLAAAAARELREETGFSDLPLTQLRAFGDPGRDPRGHTISVVFGGFLRPDADPAPRAGDDARRADWFPLDQLPPLAFDHRKIITVCLKLVDQQTLLKFWQPPKPDR